MNRMNDKQENCRSTGFRAFGWLMQRVTGVGLLLLLGLHFWLQHMPNGFLATAEEYNALFRQFGVSGGELADAVAGGTLKEALPGEHVIIYSKVLERLQSPLWKMIDIALLLLALSHGMQGLGRVVGDYIQSVPVRKVAVALGWVAASLLAWQGIATIMAVGTN